MKTQNATIPIKKNETEVAKKKPIAKIAQNKTKPKSESKANTGTSNSTVNTSDLHKVANQTMKNGQNAKNISLHNVKINNS